MFVSRWRKTTGEIVQLGPNALKKSIRTSKERYKMELSINVYSCYQNTLSRRLTFMVTRCPLSVQQTGVELAWVAAHYTNPDQPFRPASKKTKWLNTYRTFTTLWRRGPGVWTLSATLSPRNLSMPSSTSSSASSGA